MDQFRFTYPATGIEQTLCYDSLHSSLAEAEVMRVV